MSQAPAKPSTLEGWRLPLMTAGLMLGIEAARRADAWLGAAVALALCALAALLTRGTRRIIAMVLASAALGALITVHANHPFLPAEGSYTVCGVVMDEVLTADATQLRTRLSGVTLNGEPCSGDAWWTVYIDEEESPPEWLIPGTRVSFTGEVYHPGGAANPGGYDFRESLLQDGVTFGVYGMTDLQPAEGSIGLDGRLARLRHLMTMELMRVMGGESGALAAAMLLGSREYLPAEDEVAFRDLGVAHILSVSGYHVGVLAMLVTLLLGRLPVPRWLRAALLGVLVGVYALLTGAAPPVVRAATLVVLSELGHLQRRQNLPLHLLCLTASIHLLVNPMQLFGASFQLTYSAMLGLFIIHPRLQHAVQPASPLLERLWKGLSATLSVQLGLLPAQLYWFCGFPLISLVLNVFALTLTSGVMALYWLTLALLPIPLLREGVGAATGLLTRWMLAAIRFLADAVGGVVPVMPANMLTFLGWLLLIIGLSIFIPRSRAMMRRLMALAGACLIALSLLNPPHKGVYWLQFSDGEADAALLHDQDAVILVDAGEYAYTVAGYLQRHRLPVDMLILTHLHIDHAGGVQGLLDWDIPVRVCCLPEDAFLAGDADPEVTALLERLAATGTEFVYLSRGDVIDTPSGQLTVLWPQSGAVRTGQSANETCLVLRADILGTTLLLSADMTGLYEMYTAVPADVLKAAHHGSGESTSPAFLEAVSPQVILLSCGTDEREAAFLPRAGDIPVYSTHSSGGIILRFTENAFTVETFLPR